MIGEEDAPSGGLGLILGQSESSWRAPPRTPRRSWRSSRRRSRSVAVPGPGTGVRGAAGIPDETG
ncbi:MAG: hypothetical protein AVDCRST_MAG53-1628 [uncultured Solirubrobacteraceae bacterium]|uniref:Uncharacterized protein n=1 Tax=uncultured Solirubrobacteraceae bacterium TaxID=1162706 RepID=A0A6J4SG63_9ACTN|nr:MAG: hypothetical protein AVDCRST_MAG53-1628 [uncultured Solirubrobacteraceae bacterium]